RTLDVGVARLCHDLRCALRLPGWRVRRGGHPTERGRAESYRQQAEALMAQHFPEGYQIVRAEEVVEGSRTLTVGKSGNTGISPQLSRHLFALLKVGGSITRNQADTLALRECRIIYKKADPSSATASGRFGPEPSQTPTCYLDPNTELKKLDKEPVKAA